MPLSSFRSPKWGSRSGAFAVVVIVLSATAFLLWRHHEGPPLVGATQGVPEPPLTIGTLLRDDESRASVRRTAAEQSQLTSGQAPRLSVVVANEDDERIAGVRCDVLGPTASARMFAGSVGLVGKTTAEGLLLVKVEEVPQAERLVFSHPHYKSTAVESIHYLERQPLVVLARGHSQRFRCIAHDGSAVKGCRIVLSRCALPGYVGDDEEEGAPPGWPPAVSAHSCTSDGDGSATATGLDAGAYQFRIGGRRFIQVGGSRQYSVVVPGEDVEIVLGEVFVFMCEISGDEVLDHGFVFLGGHWKAAGVPTRALEIVRRELVGFHPGVLIATAASVQMPAGSTVPLRVLLKRGGIRVVDVPGFPIEGCPGPLRVDCAGLPGESREEVRLIVEDASGREIDPSGLYVLEGGNMFSGFRVHADPQGVLSMPPGQQTLRCDWLLLGNHFSPRSIVAPSNTVVRLDVGVRRCSLEYRFPWGEIAEEVKWTLRTAGEMRSFGSFKPEPVDILVPIGPLSVSAEVFGRPSVTEAVAIAFDAGDDIQRIVIAGR